MAEKEYIEREAVLAKLDEDFLKTDPSGEEQLGFLKCRRIIREHPAADVVEVVRCKDCQMWRGNDYDGCCIKNGLATRMANDFCSYGERKEETP